jgi:hypothetical protein
MARVASPLVRIRLSVYDPLNFVAFTNHPRDFPAGEYRKRLPFFARKFEVSTEDCRFSKVLRGCPTGLSLTSYWALSFIFKTVLCCCFRTANSQVLSAHTFDG